jgi:hypothetical protein
MAKEHMGKPVHLKEEQPQRSGSLRLNQRVQLLRGFLDFFPLRS